MADIGWLVPEIPITENVVPHFLVFLDMTEQDRGWFWGRTWYLVLFWAYETSHTMTGELLKFRDLSFSQSKTEVGFVAFAPEELSFRQLIVWYDTYGAGVDLWLLLSFGWLSVYKTYCRSCVYGLWNRYATKIKIIKIILSSNRRYVWWRKLVNKTKLGKRGGCANTLLDSYEPVTTLTFSNSTLYWTASQLSFWAKMRTTIYIAIIYYTVLRNFITKKVKVRGLFWPPLGTLNPQIPTSWESHLSFKTKTSSS